MHLKGIFHITSISSELYCTPSYIQIITNKVDAAKRGRNSHIMGPKSDKPMPVLQGLPGAGLKQYKTNMSNREI